MSFRFKTRGRGAPTMHAMNKPTTSPCPHRADASSAPVVPSSAGAWPPGPAAGFTGWGLLRAMSRDMFSALHAWQHAHGDVFHLRMWPEHQLVICDPALVRDLLVTHHDALIRWERAMRVFSQLNGRSVFISEGEPWRAKRHALQPNFSRQAVDAFVPTIAAAADQALSRWRTDGGRCAIESALTSLTMDVILRMMFSDQVGDDAHRVEEAVRAAVVAANAEVFWPTTSPNWMPWKRAKRDALVLLRDLIGRHVDARLRTPSDSWPDDQLTRLLHLRREDPAGWSLEAIRDECMTTFVAGHETAAATLTWWAWCMAANPAAQRAARAEVRACLGDAAPTPDTLPALRYVTQTLKETLRLYPAAPMLIARRATAPFTLGPWRVPARTMLSVPTLLMHRDPRWFDDPLAFRPERFAADAPAPPRGAYLPFGAGPRVCLGQHLAMTEMTVIAARILQRFALSAPAGMAEPRPVMNVTLRPDTPLHLNVARIARPRVMTGKPDREGPGGPDRETRAANR
jgi:unspecific monooxygenase